MPKASEAAQEPRTNYSNKKSAIPLQDRAR